MLNITIHQGNVLVSEKHMRYVITLIRMAIIRKQKMSFGEDMEKLNAYTPLVDMWASWKTALGLLLTCLVHQSAADDHGHQCRHLPALSVKAQY